MNRLFIAALTVFLIFAVASYAFSQGKVIERVSSSSNVLGWGTPLAGTMEFAEYYIASGDELDIYIWKNDDLSKKVIVRGDGKINYPLIGTIKISGLTIEEAGDKLKEAFLPYARSGVEYRIAPGDELNVYVWKNDSLSKIVIVMPDGKISYPLIGAIQAAGLTLEQLEDSMRKSLSQYVLPDTEYRITRGDELEIFIWRHKDLTKRVKVMPDGKISCPLIGTLKTEGLTVDGLQAKINEALSEYIRFPDATVSVEKIREDKILKFQDVNVSLRTLSRDRISILENVTVEVTKSAGSRVIVFGQVNNEGIYLYNGTITLFEAIAMAGGITGDGQRDSVIIVSGNLTENPEARRVNLLRAIREGTSDENMILKPDDIIYVPRTFMADFNKFLGELEPAIEKGWRIFDWRDRLRILYKHYYRTTTW